MADRFFCPDAPVDGQAILLGDEARHLMKVRRVEVGECVELFDGRGSSFQAKVSGLGRDRVKLRVLSTQTSSRPRFSITLATAVPKGERFDWLVEKATELGVDRLIPLVTERSVVDPRSAKLDRLRRTIIEASKQCRRNRLMDLDSPTAFGVLLTTSRDATRLIAHPAGPGIVSAGLRPDCRSAILAIGPEGGFTESEVEQAIREGWQAVGLGSTVLRVETAALAGSATLLAMAEAEHVGRESGEGT